MNVFISILGISMFLLSCKEQKKSDRIKNPVHEIADIRYDSILLGLSKNYVLNIAGKDKEKLLIFFLKNDSDFAEDSTQYHRSVEYFLNSDYSIVNYLIEKYKSDTSLCFWIFTHYPYSSNVKKWESGFTKEQGATVLIYNYFFFSPTDTNPTLTTFSGDIEEIIRRTNLSDIGRWIDQHSGLSLSEKKRKFIEDFKIEGVPHIGATSRDF